MPWHQWWIESDQGEDGKGPARGGGRVLIVVGIVDLGDPWPITSPSS